MALLRNQTQKAYYLGDDLGNYQFTKLIDIINQFMFAYVVLSGRTSRNVFVVLLGSGSDH